MNVSIDERFHMDECHLIMMDNISIKENMMMGPK